MNTKTKNIAKYSAIITIILIISKVFGSLREFVIAAVFGATAESDVFKIATTIPNSIFSCVSAALVTTFIPVFSIVKNDKEKSNDFFNNIVNVVTIACLILSALGMIFSKFLVKLFASGFTPKYLEMASDMTKIVMPSIIFLAIAGLYTGYLQCYGIYVQPAITSIVSNIVIIVGILVFIRYGIKAAIISFLISAVVQVIVQRPFMKGFKYKLHINLKDENLKRMIKLGTPILISATVSQISLIVDRTFASHLTAGSISVVDYASKISTLINQVFVASITTVLYPMLTEKFNNEDKTEFKKLLVKTINIVLIVTIPLMLCMIALSTPIVKLLLQHGKFNAEATKTTSMCLKYLAVSTLGFALMDSLSKTFFSARETIIPIINGFIQVVLNVILIVVFVPMFKVNGLALATTVSSLIMGTILLFEVKKRLGGLSAKKTIGVFAKSLMLGTGMALSAYAVYFGISSVINTNSIVKLTCALALSGITALIALIILSKLLKISEIEEIIGFKFKKKQHN